MYAYAGDNPTTNNDPSGLSWCEEGADGGINLSTCVSDKAYQSLKNPKGYLHVSNDTSISVNGSQATQQDYMFALGVGIQRAAPAVNDMAVAFSAFAALVMPETIGEEAPASLGTLEAPEVGGTATVDDILQGAQKIGSSSSRQYFKGGGLEQAESDFESLEGREEISGSTRYKELPGGRRAVLRTDPSTWGDHPGPTIEIQPRGGGYARIKIRY